MKEKLFSPNSQNSVVYNRNTRPNYQTVTHFLIIIYGNIFSEQIHRISRSELQCYSYSIFDGGLKSTRIVCTVYLQI